MGVTLGGVHFDKCHHERGVICRASRTLDEPSRVWERIRIKIGGKFIAVVMMTSLDSLLFLDVLASRQVTVKFVQDTSKFWYKPDIARDQGERLYFWLSVSKRMAWKGQSYM